ncbi:putative nuclease HARBI1 [Prorops nasuta]|uniref:putative nuclease HARBI1 n=1 Tax=Prorops nasuta TaxID=863751 RepID=UPI0034CED085
MFIDYEKFTGEKYAVGNKNNHQQYEVGKTENCWFPVFKNFTVQNISNNWAYSIMDFVLFASSSSSSSEDEEDMFILDADDREEIPKIRNYYQEKDLLQLTLILNTALFRMNRQSFDLLLYFVGPELNKRTILGRERIDPVLQLLMAIYILATPDSYRSISEKFGVTQSTAWNCLKRVVKAIYNIRNYFIKWPTVEEAKHSWELIFQKYGFPKVLGFIDGTHIYIAKPKEQAVDYINGKQRYSIQLQVICKNDLSFMHVFAGMPGSVHDMRVFKYSGVQQLCTSTYFPEDSHLLGDAAYINQRHVMTPFINNGHLSREQEIYNTRLSSARLKVERSIGLLKRRWRYLVEKLPMTKTDLIPYYIITCCVLHNFCLLNNNMYARQPITPGQLHEMSPLAVPLESKSQGDEKRNEIMQIINNNL